MIEELLLKQNDIIRSAVNIGRINKKKNSDLIFAGNRNRNEDSVRNIKQRIGSCSSHKINRKKIRLILCVFLL